MSGLYGFILLLHIIASALVVLIILIQPAKGEGLTGAFGAGGNTQALFGVRAGDVMTKATAFIAVFFVITSITLAFLQVKKSSSVMDRSNNALSAAAAHVPSAPVDPNAKSDVLDKYTGQVKGKIKNLFAGKEKEGVVATTAVKEETAAVEEISAESIPVEDIAPVESDVQPQEESAEEAVPATEDAAQMSETDEQAA